MPESNTAHGLLVPVREAEAQALSLRAELEAELGHTPTPAQRTLLDALSRVFVALLTADHPRKALRPASVIKALLRMLGLPKQREQAPSPAGGTLRDRLQRDTR